MTMWEEASKTYFLGVQVYSFGLFAALGLALALAVLALLLHRAKWKRGTAALTGVLAMIAGLIVSRLFFGLLDQTLGVALPLWAMVQVTAGGFSMMGALLGACMGAILAAKITRQNAARLLDFLAPAFLLFVSCERLGEGYIDDFGISRYLVGDLFKGSFLAVDGGGEWYLATYLIESFAALVIALILLRDLNGKRRAGDTFILFLLLFGASQTILESLRYDQHMHYAFVGLQHVMAMALLGSALIVLYIRRKKERRGLALAGLISIPLAVILGVGLEFAIDRTQMNRYVLYALYLIVLGVPAYLGIRLRREA
ncbi:MAG: prolipoprotein diacylglyceryl transferase [Clostridia bacterium]|nr:prolipoprotein diacylglyceryl transferase [Clostridia bacterium]